ncbi:amphi-Trp domain-containing protein [Geodermatophilus sp. SYSU D00758]
MSDVKVEREVTLSRQEAARWFAELARALEGTGKVTLPHGPGDGGGTTVELRVPDEVRAEAEIEVDGDEVEIEIELSWSTGHARRPAAGSRSGDGG